MISVTELRRQLEVDMLVSLSAAWAKDTRKNMLVQQQLYWDFCTVFEYTPLPATHTVICLYAQFLPPKATERGGERERERERERGK